MTLLDSCVVRIFCVPAFPVGEGPAKPRGFCEEETNHVTRTLYSTFGNSIPWTYLIDNNLGGSGEGLHRVYAQLILHALPVAFRVLRSGVRKETRWSLSNVFNSVQAAYFTSSDVQIPNLFAWWSTRTWCMARARAPARGARSRICSVTWLPGL